MKRVVSGFTIIEVILFLAVASFMLTAVIASSGSVIGAQRYKDSVTSLQSFIQNQYFEVSNVRNQLRTETLTCNSKGEVKFGGSASQNRGRSNCVILGKYITVGTTSNVLNVYPVVGINNGAVSGTDVEVLQKYTLVTVPELLEIYNVEWGSGMLNNASLPATFTVLIVLSPSSGSIRTFINTSNNAKLDKVELVNDTALKRDLLICVDDSNSIGINRMGVKINAGATNGSAVEMIGDAVSKANGGCA